MIFDNPLDKISLMVFSGKESIKALRKQIKSQDELLRDTATLLNEIRESLFEIKQGELFDDGSIESITNNDDIECKNEVFGELRDLLGNEQAEKVADYFSGSLVYFSKNVVVARKYREIRKAFREGATYRDLGTKYGYTETHIRRIVHKGGKNT
jgi:Mor family transcriptional regulator